ncbi:MAG: cation:proton antiporter [Chloroflexota bacterium]|nr:cation:proton antiporter [Chloroflexota bacterium]
MSEELHLLLNVAVAVAIALVGGLLAHALRQSVIVGYLLAGMAIGPFTPGFIGDREEIAALAEVGVIFLMFALGIEFSLKELARVRGVALVGTGAQVLLTIAAGVGLGAFLGWPLPQGLFFGGVIAISSTMVILKTLLDRGEVTASHGRVLLGMLIVQDLIVVILIVLLPQLLAGADAALSDSALLFVKAGAFIGATLFLGARVVPRLMARVERLRSPELFLLTAVALALGTATVSALLGLSPALGAFMGGLMLTETEFDHRVVAEVVPMRNLFATLFFVSVGMLIDPPFIWRNLPAVAGLALFIMAVKILATMVAVLPFRLGGKTAVFTSLGMLQIGEFSYVLARTGREIGAIGESLNSLILAASLVTIVLTPGAFWIAPRVDRALARVPALGRLFAARSTVLAPEETLAGHAIVAGYGRVGRHVADGLRATGLPVVVIEEDLHLVQGLTAAGVPAIYGDASYASVLAAAHPERARLIVVALPDSGATRVTVRNARRANPAAPILTRLVREDDEAPLRAAGATTLIGPERAGALLLLEESRRVLNVPGAPPAPAAVVARDGQQSYRDDDGAVEPARA